MDWLILFDPYNCRLFERILINVEFQSFCVTEEKIRVISDYKDYARQVYERKLTEKDKVLSEMDSAIAEKERENKILRAKLEENGIEYRLI